MDSDGWGYEKKSIEEQSRAPYRLHTSLLTAAVVTPAPAKETASNVAPVADREEAISTEHLIYTIVGMLTK